MNASAAMFPSAVNSGSPDFDQALELVRTAMAAFYAVRGSMKAGSTPQSENLQEAYKAVKADTAATQLLGLLGVTDSLVERLVSLSKQASVNAGDYANKLGLV